MTALLRSVWREPRAPGAPPRGPWDVLLVGIAVTASLVEPLLRPDLPDRWVWAVVGAALAPALLWRRSRPLLVLAVVLGTGTVVQLLLGRQGDAAGMAWLLIVIYAVFRWGSGREAVVGGGIVAVHSGVAFAADDLVLEDLIGGLAVLTATIALGTAFRFRAKARQRELEQVALIEREGLARDLHDTVAHHVAAMAIRAQAGLATADADPRAAREALRIIEGEASLALAEMRAMIRVLRRDEQAERTPTPRLADLARLTGADAPGPTVEVTLSGDLDDLPPSLGTAVYRLAQESVTNALRHASHASRIEVHVTADATGVLLRVRDDGDGAARSRVAAAPGYGLRGMAERAALLGGTLQAGPDPDRGWTVTAQLPREAAR